jgi:serine/threonine protein kinase
MDFITGLLLVDPTIRMSIEEALAHPVRPPPSPLIQLISSGSMSIQPGLKCIPTLSLPNQMEIHTVSQNTTEWYVPPRKFMLMK